MQNLEDHLVFPALAALLFLANRPAAIASICAAVSVFLDALSRLVQQRHQPTQSDPQQAGGAEGERTSWPVSGW